MEFGLFLFIKLLVTWIFMELRLLPVDPRFFEQFNMKNPFFIFWSCLLPIRVSILILAIWGCDYEIACTRRRSEFRIFRILLDWHTTLNSTRSTLYQGQMSEIIYFHVYTCHLNVNLPSGGINKQRINLETHSGLFNALYYNLFNYLGKYTTRRLIWPYMCKLRHFLCPFLHQSPKWGSPLCIDTLCVQ